MCAVGTLDNLSHPVTHADQESKGDCPFGHSDLGERCIYMSVKDRHDMRPCVARMGIKPYQKRLKGTCYASGNFDNSISQLRQKSG